jgi:NDP-hexose-3-ketoreductase
MTIRSVVNIGVLGLASIATRSVIPAIGTLRSRFHLAGIASRDILKAQTASLAFGAKAYNSYESLLIDQSIGAVYIPLPNALHYPYVMMALSCGKHVLVEKSLGCSTEEVGHMVDLAKEKGLVLLENFQFRFHSQLPHILQRVSAGSIGDLRAVRVAFGFPPFLDSSNIRYSAELGGGALLDAGAYPMKLAPYFLGNDISVTDGSMAFDRMRGIDIWGGGTLQQVNGPLFYQFAYGFDHFYQCSLELWGSKGKISTGRIFTAPPNLMPKLLIETSSGAEEIILPRDNHFENMMEYFYQLIIGLRPKSVEYYGNIQQAGLIQQFKVIADRKADVH